MHAVEPPNPGKKPMHLSLDSELLKEAKELGVNISRLAEAGIAEAVKQHRQQKWLEDNAEALASSNAYVDTNGLPLARYRQF